MTDSPTLGLDLQATGSNSGTWGTVTNANLSIVDNRNGGSLAVNVAGSSNVTLTESNVENVFLRLTGVLTGNIDLIFPATRGGTYLIQNDSTGSFSITAKPSGGTGVTVPQGAMTVVFVNLTLSAAYKVNAVSASAANTWSAIQTFSAGITGTGSIGTLTVNNSNWSGTDLSVANGGTGASTLTGLLQGNGTGAITGGATVNNSNWSGTDLAVTNGGSGVSTAGAAFAVFADGLTDNPFTAASNDWLIVRDNSDGSWGRFTFGSVFATFTPWSVANGGTGASTLTGLLQGNGTGAITGGATINNSNWSGTDLSVANGGTGASTLTGILIGNGTSAVTGTGSSTLGVANGGTGAATLTGLLQGNGTGAITGGATINNSNWSGTDLSVANGGTGASTLTGLLQGNGTGAITGGATINNSDWSGTDLAIANGGTGQSTAAAGARALLDGLGTTANNVPYYDGAAWTVVGAKVSTPNLQFTGTRGGSWSGNTYILALDDNGPKWVLTSYS